MKNEVANEESLHIFTNNWNSFYIACLSQISMSAPQGPTIVERIKCASIYVAPSHASVFRGIRREESSVWVSPWYSIKTPVLRNFRQQNKALPLD